MKRNIIMTLAAAASLFAAISCSEKEFAADGRTISVSAGIVSGKGETKALLEPEQLLTTGTEVTFYGLAFDKATAAPMDIPGHVGTSGSGTTKLNDGQTIRYDGMEWAYASGEEYQWRAGADHLFFGWLKRDAASSLEASSFLPGMSYDASQRKLTIPAKTMTISADGMDFSYSEVVSRKASGADFSTVALSLKHLFTSFSLAAHNYTSSDIVIKSVKLYGIRNSKGAAVTFGDDGSSAEYTAGTTVYEGGGTYFELVSEASGIALDADAHKTNVIRGASDSHKYILMWPQTAEELTAESSSETEFEPVGENPAYMKVVYSQGGGENMTVNVRIPFDAGIGWAAGTRHNMELSFYEKKMVVGVYAANWDETEPVIDYNGTIAVTDLGKLRVAEGCNCVVSNDTVYFKPGFPVILEFKIDQPVNSTWLVRKKGDFDVFDIDNYDNPASVLGDTNDTAEGLITTAATKSHISLYPRITELQKNEYKMKLSFYVRLNSGEMTNIDELIYDDESPVTFILLKD